MTQTAVALKKKATSSFFSKGITLAVLSGVTYGLFTAFLTLAETQGIWADWFGETSVLSAFAVVFILASLASGINDLFSGLWSLIFAAGHGELGDFVKTCKTKPGRIMMLCAIVGGPGGATLYVVALNMATAAGSPGIIVPVAALNVAVGAVLSRIFFKQELNARMAVGILICLVCCGVIGGTSFSNIGISAIIACLFAFGAAICWGFEGCVAGFGTALIDYNIGITIRQLTSGIVTLFILVPVLCLVGGDGLGLFPQLLGGAFSSPATYILVVSGFFAMFAYSLWYKGNSMCGTALGMACNGMYAFWGPFFIWIVNGVLNLGGMAEAYPPLLPVQWIAAVIMALGIFVIAVNPLDFLKSSNDENEGVPSVHSEVIEERNAEAQADIDTCPDAKSNESAAPVSLQNDSLPLTYAVFSYCSQKPEVSTESVMNDLSHAYGSYAQFKPAGIEEVLMTGTVNGLLDETRYDLDQKGKLQNFYAMNDYGREMVASYIQTS